MDLSSELKKIQQQKYSHSMGINKKAKENERKENEIKQNKLGENKLDENKMDVNELNENDVENELKKSNQFEIDHEIALQLQNQYENEINSNLNSNLNSNPNLNDLNANANANTNANSHSHSHSNSNSNFNSNFNLNFNGNGNENQDQKSSLQNSGNNNGRNFQYSYYSSFSNDPNGGYSFSYSSTPNVSINNVLRQRFNPIPNFNMNFENFGNDNFFASHFFGENMSNDIIFEELSRFFPIIQRGATNQQINNNTQIDKYQKNKSEDNPHKEKTEECCICRDKFEENDEIRRLPCMHIFHKNEIDEWLRRKDTCPICRVSINPSTQ